MQGLRLVSLEARRQASLCMNNPNAVLMKSGLLLNPGLGLLQHSMLGRCWAPHQVKLGQTSVGEGCTGMPLPAESTQVSEK